MKFTDGQWLYQPGVIAHCAAEAHSIASVGGKLSVHAPTRPIKDRGDTLQGPLLTVKLSAPAPDVLRVRIEHFAGGTERSPRLPIVPQADPAAHFHDDDAAADSRPDNSSHGSKRKRGESLSRPGAGY